MHKGTWHCGILCIHTVLCHSQRCAEILFQQVLAHRLPLKRNEVASFATKTGSSQQLVDKNSVDAAGANFYFPFFSLIVAKRTHLAPLALLSSPLCPVHMAAHIGEDCKVFYRFVCLSTRQRRLESPKWYFSKMGPRVVKSENADLRCPIVAVWTAKMATLAKMMTSTYRT